MCSETRLITRDRQTQTVSFSFFQCLKAGFTETAMVRSYMRHGPTQVSDRLSISQRIWTHELQAFGVICSPTANSAFDGKLAFVAGWEDVLVWDVKRGEMVRRPLPIVSLHLANSKRCRCGTHHPSPRL